VRATAALAGPYNFLPLDVEATIAAFGQTKNLAATQPINFISRSAPPMFLATGDQDTTVYPRNTTGLAAKLREAGADVAEKTYPGMTHAGMVLALSRPFRGQAPVLADVTAFFRAH
jgi:acetyl esterase/lipase